MNSSSFRASCVAGILVSALLWHGSVAALDWFPYKAEFTEPAFSASGKKVPVDYMPLIKASKKWDICVSFPHLKDAYWLGVNFGVTDEAKRLGVTLKLSEAGGYANLAKQVSQIEDCVSRGANAVVVGGISADGLSNVLSTVSAKKIPIIDLVNGINSSDVSAKSLISFYNMGQATGEYLAKKHPTGSAVVKVGWFPGPSGAAWVEAAHRGFMDAINGSAVTALDPKYGDTGKEAQAKLVGEVLQAHPDLAYVAGTAVTAEAAVSIVLLRGLQKKVRLLSFYLTPDVYIGIAKGHILAAPTDSMVIQGRIAIDQAVRILEGKEVIKHVGPKVFVVDESNYKKVKFADILPPPDFRPVFDVK